MINDIINKEVIFNESDINIIKVNSGDLKKQFFCKCGHTWQQKKCFDISCPKCKNNKELTINFSYYNRKFNIIKNFTKIIYKKNDVSIQIGNIPAVYNGITNNIELNDIVYKEVINFKKGILEIKDNKEIGEILKGNLPIFNDLNFEEFKNNYSYYDNKFEKINYSEVFQNNFCNNIYEGNQDFTTYVSYCLVSQLCKNIEEIPLNFLMKLFYCKYFINGNFINYTFDDILYKFGYYDFKDAFYEDWFLPKFINLEIIDFNILKELKENILYGINHYRITLDEIYKIVKDYNNFKLRDYENIEIFYNFMKKNFLVYRGNIIREYFERINWLSENNFKISTENLNNYKFLLNKQSLINLKYPEKKINYVLDLFYQNPLKAMEYLSTTKNLSVKEINEIIDLIK